MLHESVRNLNHPVDKVRNEAVRKLKWYFRESDYDANDRRQRRVLAQLRRMRVPASREILDYYEGLRRQDLHFEEEIKKYVKSSRIKMKEFFEAKAFFQKVDPFFPEVESVADLCAGNGLLGTIWALEKGLKSYCVNKKYNENFTDLSKLVAGVSKFEVEYMVKDITQEELPKVDAYISIHPCGNLGDIIIDLAVEKKMPFAIMPCCHSQSRELQGDILKYFDKQEAIDVGRVVSAQEKGYSMYVRKINPRITDKNRILIGIP